VDIFFDSSLIFLALLVVAVILAITLVILLRDILRFFYKRALRKEDSTQQTKAKSDAGMNESAREDERDRNERY